MSASLDFKIKISLVTKQRDNVIVNFLSAKCTKHVCSSLNNDMPISVFYSWR